MKFSQTVVDSQIQILHKLASVVPDLFWLAPVLSFKWFSICSCLVRSSHADGARNVPLVSASSSGCPSIDSVSSSSFISMVLDLLHLPAMYCGYEECAMNHSCCYYRDLLIRLRGAKLICAFSRQGEGSISCGEIFTQIMMPISIE